MSVTATDLQNLIISTLSNADPTALSGLQTNVPKYWLLWARQGVLPELQYWYVRREAIRYMMGCINRQIDYILRTQSAARTMTASARQDDSMNANFSETASSNADRSSSSNYSDETNSTGSGSGTGNRNANQSMSGSGSLLDDGSGSNVASQSSSFTSDSTINASSSDSASAQRYTNREICGDHTRYHAAAKTSAGFIIDLGIGGGTAATDTKTWETEVGTITEAQSGQGTSAFNAKQDDLRENSLSQTALQSSSSSFNAHRIASDSMSASGSSHMSASSSSNFSMSGSGTGTMVGTGAGGSAMTVSASRVAHADGEAHRLSQSESQTNSTMERLHQRFLHLQELWDRANEMIAWFEKQRLNLAPYVLQAITIQYPSGLNADSANKYLVKTPFGLGMGR